MSEAICFYTVTALMLAAACSVVFNRHPLYGVLSLLVVMFCLAGFFVMLNAYFLAALQILLYAGAVLVLFLFAIMLLNLEPGSLARLRLLSVRTVAASAVALLFFTQVIRMVKTRGGEPPLFAVPAPDGTVEAVGRLLFTHYLLPFELTSFLILAAIIGAVTLAKHNE